MVGDPVVGPVIGADFLAYISFSYLTFTLLFFRCNSLVVEMLVESFPQSCKSTLFVLRLLSRILTLGSDACRFMSCSACTGCLVYMLATGSLCSVEVKSDFFHVDREFSWHLGHHQHYCCAWVEAAFDFRLGNSLHFMNTWFVLEVLVDISACHMQAALLASFMQLHIDLQLRLLGSPAHQPAVLLVHFEDLTSK